MSTRLSLILALAFLCVAGAQAQVSTKQIIGNADLEFTGGNAYEIKGLKLLPTTDASAATKKYVDDSTGTTVEGNNLTAAGDTITPLSSVDVINVYSPAAAVPSGVTFNHSFNSEDADYAVSSGTKQSDLGSPVFSGGYLDLTNGDLGYNAISATYAPTNIPVRLNSGGGDTLSFRVLMRPNWDGNPTQNVQLITLTNGTAISGNTSTFQLLINSSGIAQVILYDALGNLVGSVGRSLSASLTRYGSRLSWKKGRLYEIEVNIDWDNDMTIHVDGQSYANDTSLGVTFFEGQPTAELIFGGENGSLASDQAPNYSNHVLEGVTIANSNTDERLHDSTFHYIPTYDIAGSTVSQESITKLDGAFYSEGDIVTLVNKVAGGGFTLASTASPGVNELDLRTKFSPKAVDDSITVQFSGLYWAERSRHYVDSDLGPDIDQVTLVAAGDTVVPGGSSTVTVFGSKVAFSNEVTFLADFADNSFVPDYSVGALDTYFNGNGTASPIMSGGQLNMNTTGYQTSSFFWGADPGNNQQTTDEGTVRVLFTPNYSGTPTSSVAIFERTRGGENDGLCGEFPVSDADCRYKIRLYHRSDGNLEAHTYDWAANQVRHSYAWSPTLGQEYEIEFSWNYTTGNTRLFVDGTQVSTLGTLINDQKAADRATMAHFTLGGAGITPYSYDGFGFANNSYGGFAFFNAEQHTASYTATGLPGSSNVFDTIIGMTGDTYYREGQRVRVRCGEASRFKFQSTASPGMDEFLLNADWSPTSDNEYLDLVRTNGYWVELARYPIISGVSGSGAEESLAVWGSGGAMTDSDINYLSSGATRYLSSSASVDLELRAAFGRKVVIRDSEDDNSSIEITSTGVDVAGGLDVSGGDLEMVTSSNITKSAGNDLGIQGGDQLTLETAAGGDGIVIDGTDIRVAKDLRSVAGTDLTLKPDDNRDVVVEGATVNSRVWGQEWRWGGQRVGVGFGVPINTFLPVASITAGTGTRFSALALQPSAGGNSISAIVGSGYVDGDHLEVTYDNSLGGGLTLVDTATPGNDQMALAGNVVFTVDTVVVLRWKRTGFSSGYWQEVSRSVN